VLLLLPPCLPCAAVLVVLLKFQNELVLVVSVLSEERKEESKRDGKKEGRERREIECMSVWAICHLCSQLAKHANKQGEGEMLKQRTPSSVPNASESFCAIKVATYSFIEATIAMYPGEW
jgi:hypothetical protein